MSSPVNTPQQLLGIMKTAKAGQQRGIRDFLQPEDPDDVPSTSRQAQMMNLRSKNVIGRESTDTLSKTSIECHILYHNTIDGSSEDDDFDYDDDQELNEGDDQITLSDFQATNWKNINWRNEHNRNGGESVEINYPDVWLPSDSRSPDNRPPLSLYIPNETASVNGCGDILRNVGRSIIHWTVRIAAGFGLSRQQTAWYKHCWHNPGPQPRGLNVLGLRNGYGEITMPSPSPINIPILLPMPTMMSVISNSQTDPKFSQSENSSSTL